MAYQAGDFIPSVTIEGTTSIKDTDDKIRIIIDEVGDYVEGESQGISDYQANAQTTYESGVDAKITAIETTANEADTNADIAIDATEGFQAQLDDLTSGGETTYTTTVIDAKDQAILTEAKTYTDDKPSGFKNHIINGDFGQANYPANIDTAPIASSNVYQIDRFKTSVVGTTATMQRLLNQAVNGKKVNTLNQTATLTVSGRLGYFQRLEEYRIGETVTFSVWAKSNNVNARLLLHDGITYSSANHTGGGGWELLSVTKTVSESGNKLDAYLRISTSSNSNVSITTGDYIESTMWQLESGTTATSFEQLLRPMQLQNCRYFYRVSISNLDVNDLAYEMRVTPTETGVSPYYYDAEL